uniref:Xanthine dehydrogenase/oxidase n=1 Tax=Scleropages formosus TaxID=113540 RepID=A0A8C9SVW9_SCLFO
MQENKSITFIPFKQHNNINCKSYTEVLFITLNKLLEVGLTGTKLGCAEGGCGACTVMVSRFSSHQDRIIHFAVNACLAPLCSLHHSAVTTVEGIGSVASKLHPVQERIARAHGSQCGFCTPGIVMSMYALLRNNPQPSLLDIEEAFQGEVLRSYQSKTFVCSPCWWQKETYMESGWPCTCSEACTKREYVECMKMYQKCSFQQCTQENFMPLDPTQEIIFPIELLGLSKKPLKQLCFQGERVLWIQPSSLTELLDFKTQYPEARLVVGNTEVGIEMKFKNLLYPVILAPAFIPELNTVQRTADGILFGAACTLTRLGMVLRDAVQELPTYQTEVFRAVLEQLRWFAGQQVRNVAAIGGNIVTASPISDLNPVFLAAGCKLTLASKGRVIEMDDSFFPGYRKTVLKPDEILLFIEIPFTKKGQYFSAFKQSQRREDDIATVTCAMNVAFEENTNSVRNLRLSYGGMAPTTVLAKETCKRLTGRKWSDELLQDACSLLAKEMTLDPSAPGGMVTYRRTLTISLFFKFYLIVQHKLKAKEGQNLLLRQNKDDVVGRPIMHLSALKQATGEAVYCDDIPCYDNELHLALVTSTKAHAFIENIDTKEAMCVPGVVAFLTAKDIPGSNRTGPAVYDETVLAEDMVTCVGHIIAAIVADTQAHAQRAAKAVKITYKELKPVVTIQEAISCKSFYQPTRKIEQGNIEEGFKKADHILEGEMHIGGQEHFYLETNCTLAVPRGEDGEMEMFVSTQSTSKTQMLVAKALGVPANRIVCRVKRMGGGFGGKECRSTILSTVVAKPVRCMLDRDEDMLVTGGRHPFLGRYKVGFMKTGRIVSLEVTYYSNAGNSADLSLSILERALFHMENCYNIPHIRGMGYMCKTNLPSNTAFRGFGGPQGMMVAESWMGDVALHCGLPVEQVRRLNMYKQGDRTPFTQRLEQFTIDRCWEECLSISQYNQRRKAIEQFNRQHRWKKRGIAVIPTKFGISFTALFLNQAGALVHVYIDGSVLLTHGGTEMGQGLHTKMVQVASKVLGIPCSKIHISETSTSTVPNTSPTAASASSDLNGMAIYDACQTLNQRLQPYKTKNPKGTWEDWVKAAYFDRVNLSANGFYKTPDMGYDFETNEGKPFNYFSYGVACSEVEVDCLTGDHKNLHTSIVMDVGNSLNPAIDIGQVEGAFMQGVGLFTLEELLYSPEGVLLTRGPGMYKIPAFGDIPTELNVSLLRDAPNEKAIFSSKAVGEPPLFLAASVFYAIKDAITAARAESGLRGPFRLDSPATPERIRNACEDSFTKLVPEAGTYKPWAVQV